jgi:hypothetical protein
MAKQRRQQSQPPRFPGGTRAFKLTGDVRLPRGIPGFSLAAPGRRPASAAQRLAQTQRRIQRSDTLGYQPLRRPGIRPRLALRASAVPERSPRSRPSARAGSQRRQAPADRFSVITVVDGRVRQISRMPEFCTANVRRAASYPCNPSAWAPTLVRATYQRHQSVRRTVPALHETMARKRSIRQFNGPFGRLAAGVKVKIILTHS